MTTFTLTIRFISGETVPVQWNAEVNQAQMADYIQKFLAGAVPMLGSVAMNRKAIAMIEVAEVQPPAPPSTEPPSATTESESESVG